MHAHAHVHVHVHGVMLYMTCHMWCVTSIIVPRWAVTSLIRTPTDLFPGTWKSPPSKPDLETAGAAPGMEVEAADKRGTAKKAAAKKGASSKAVLDYVQEVLARSK